MIPANDLLNYIEKRAPKKFCKKDLTIPAESNSLFVKCAYRWRLGGGREQDSMSFLLKAFKKLL
jgi:hypothetical protein